MCGVGKHNVHHTRNAICGMSDHAIYPCGMDLKEIQLQVEKTLGEASCSSGKSDKVHGYVISFTHFLINT